MEFLSYEGKLVDYLILTSVFPSIVFSLRPLKEFNAARSFNLVCRGLVASVLGPLFGVSGRQVVQRPISKKSPRDSPLHVGS